jgi:hypothetical protein
MPGIPLRRRLTMIARRQELGKLPARMAQFARQTLRDKCLPAIAESMPSVAEELLIGTGTAERGAAV